MARLETRWLSALLAGSLGAGCMEYSQIERLDASPGRTGADAAVSLTDAGPGQLTDPRDDPTQLDVSLRARPASICRGDCSELTVAVPRGRPPFSWLWSHGLPAEQGPHRVCPTSTTEYSLEVRDTPGGDVEFPEPAARGSASATVTVREDCDAGSPVDASPLDAGVASDAGAETALPATAPEPCTLRIPLDPPNANDPFMWGTASSDAAGNLVLAAVMTGSAQVGDGPRLVTPAHVTRVFVAKYDARCQFQWVRWIGEPQETSRFGSMELNAEGQIALTRTYFVEPAQPNSYRSQLLTLTRDGDHAWSIDSAGGNLFHVAQMHGLAWGRDGSLAVFGLPQLCANPAKPGACVAKVTPQGALAFGRLIGGAMGAGVALDSAGNVIAAGLSGDQGISVDGLDAPKGVAPFAYVTKFDAAGQPTWLRIQPIDRSVPRNSTPGFVSAANDGSLLLAWNDALPRPGRPLQLLTRLWHLTPEGVERSLSTLDIVGTNGVSDPTYATSARGELLSAEYLNYDLSKGRGPTPGATRLTWHAPDGATLRTLDLEETAFGVPSSIRSAAADQPILVSLEFGESKVAGAQTALVVRRLPR